MTPGTSTSPGNRQAGCILLVDVGIGGVFVGVFVVGIGVFNVEILVEVLVVEVLEVLVGVELVLVFVGVLGVLEVRLGGVVEVSGRLIAGLLGEFGSGLPDSSSPRPASEDKPAAIALNMGCSPGACTGTLATMLLSLDSSDRLFFDRLPRRAPGSDFRPVAAAESTGSACSRIPRPLQFGHDVENASISPVPNRLRVNCTSPSDVTSDTWWRVRSRASDSVNRRNTKSRLDSSTMSMKSMTTMPPISRSRSWRTISSAASRLFLVTVCSRLPRLR